VGVPLKKTKKQMADDPTPNIPTPPTGGEGNLPTIENNNNPKGGEGGGDDPGKNGKPSDTGTFDLSKIGDDDFEKIFDDPRLWKHSRFKDLNDKAKKVKEFEDAQAKAEEDALKKKGEFEELAKRKEAELNEYKQKHIQSVTDTRIQTEAAKLGIVDLEAALKLIDRSAIAVSDDGTVSGVEIAVKALLDAKPYLKGGTTPTIGAPTNPGGDDNGGFKFKRSQLQNHAFWQEHEKEIMEAIAKGQVENDLAK
jgi:hypothetical protein